MKNMAGARGRGRGGNKRVNDSKNPTHQDLRASRGEPQSRYITRSVRASLTRCANSTFRNNPICRRTTGNHPRTLTKARRVVVRKTNDDPLQPAAGANDGDPLPPVGTNDIASKRSTSLLPDKDDPVIHSVAGAASSNSSRGNNTMLLPHPATDNGDLQSAINPNNIVSDDLDMSISAESMHVSAPVSNHRSGLVNNLTSKEPPRHIYEPLKRDYVGPGMRKSTNNCGSAVSNFTEYAKKLLEDDDYMEEIESPLDPELVDVGGHKVKRNIASLVGLIFERYGDITSESNVKSFVILSLFLERLCDIYKMLEAKTFSTITPSELKSMTDEIEYLESQKLRVGWLRGKIEYLYQKKVCDAKNYLRAKDTAAKDERCIVLVEKELEVYERDFSDLQKKISAARDELASRKASADQNKRLVREIKDRLNTPEHSLVDGLL